MVDQPLALVAALRTQLEAWQPMAGGARARSTVEE